MTTTATFTFAPVRTTWRTGGRWTDTGTDDSVEVTGALIRSADKVGGYHLHFRKGYRFEVDAATAAELRAAGFGGQLRRCDPPPERAPRPDPPVWATVGQVGEIEALRERVAALEAERARWLAVL